MSKDFNKDDVVIFSKPNYMITDHQGNNPYEGLVENKEYIVEESRYLTLVLKNHKGVYLKEHFTKVTNGR